MKRAWAAIGACVLLTAVVLALRASGSAAYLSDRPEACASCHEMAPRHAGWTSGPHRRVATCADCHVPHEGVWAALAAKAQDGTRHGLTHASGRTPRFLHVKRDAARETLRANCLRCHGERITPAAWRALPPLGSGSGTTRPRPETAFHADESRACADCHRATGHAAR